MTYTLTKYSRGILKVNPLTDHTPLQTVHAGLTLWMKNCVTIKIDDKIFCCVSGFCILPSMIKVLFNKNTTEYFGMFIVKLYGTAKVPKRQMDLHSDSALSKKSHCQSRT